MEETAYMVRSVMHLMYKIICLLSYEKEKKSSLAKPNTKMNTPTADDIMHIKSVPLSLLMSQQG